MDKTNKEELKARIHEEMMIDYSNALEKNFEIAKQMIQITREGKVNIFIKDSLRGTDQILLYLIGKLYAKEAGLCIEEGVTNDELMEELGLPLGSLLPWIKRLRDRKKIKSIKKDKYSYHTVPRNLVEKTLKEIKEKLEKVI